MPINFQATFITPLLAQLDAGEIGGGEDFATAIVDAYINTVKTGLPQNVVATLPAPGLNPTAPPPFPIGASAFLTADQRKKKMSTIINAYFKAKDGTIEKANIDSLKITIERVVSSAKAAKDQINGIVAEVEVIAVEIKKFPETIEDIKKGLQEEVDRMKKVVDSIEVELLASVSIGGINEVARVFADQINFIQTLKEFKLTTESLSSLLRFIKNQEEQLKKDFGTQKDTKKTTANYINAKLLSIAKHLIKIARSVLDPIALLSYIEQLVPLVPSLKKVYEKIKKFKIIKDFLERKLYRLNQKKITIQKQLNTYIEPKIKELSEILAKKIANIGRNKKKEKAITRYKKAAKDVDEKKKAFNERIAKRKRKIEKLVNISNLANKVLGDSVLLAADISKEWDVLVIKIKEYKERIEAIEAEKKLLLEQNIKGPTKLNIKPLIPEQFKLSKDVTASQAASLAKNIGSPNNLNAELLRLELNKIKAQFLTTSLGPYTALASNVIRSAGTDYKTLKAFLNIDEAKWEKESISKLAALKVTFEKELQDLKELYGDNAKGSIIVLTSEYEKEKKNIEITYMGIKPAPSKYDSYVSRIIKIQSDLKSIRTIVKTIEETDSEEKEPEGKKVGKEYTGLTTRIRSLSKLLQYITTNLEPDISKLILWIETQIQNAVASVKEQIKIFIEVIQKFLLSNIPSNSILSDVIEKKQRLKDRKALAKYKVDQAKRLVEETQLIIKMAGGAVKLITNIRQGQYKYASNEPNINLFVDSYYDLLYVRETGIVSPDAPVVGASPEQTAARALAQATAISQLSQDKEYYNSEKKRVKKKFKPLILIDLLLYGIIETLKDVKNSTLAVDLRAYIEIVESKTDSPGKNTIAALKKIMEIMESPPTNPSEIISIAKILKSNLFKSFAQDINIVTPLSELEIRHLAKSRLAIEKLCDLDFVGEDTDTARKIVKIKKALNDNRSFILTAFDMLLTEIELFKEYLRKIISQFVDKQKAKLEKRKSEITAEVKARTKKELDAKVNVEAVILTGVLGLAARLFWTGASWYGPTGTKHTVLNIGKFTKMKFLASSGRSGMITEIARGFENQLASMLGLITPPLNTGIPPFTFTGYLPIKIVAINYTAKEQGEAIVV